MKVKEVIIFLIIISNILIINSGIAEAKGVILADDQKVLEIFRDYDQNQILELAREISEYDKVILHLGARKVFTRGHPFFYNTSKKNLQIFSRQLEKQNQKFYLWFLDSFGSKMFLDIYDNHQDIIDDNYSQLKELDLNYDGIVIDLEWINLGQKNNLYNNQDKYLEVLKYLRNKFEFKELYAFMSIVDDPHENLEPGYDEDEISKYLDNIITMLYIKDSGFYLNESEADMVLKKNRIRALRKYYQKNNYQTAVSLEGGIFLERNKKLYFIKTTNNFNYKKQSRLFYTKEKEYYKISGYKLEKSLVIKRNDGIQVELKEDERLHFLEIKADNLLAEDDYIWEYFQLKK